MKRVEWFWVAVAVSFAASLTPWALPLLYPFKIFTTWVHECSHALMTVLVGGRVTAITIEPNTSGLTHSLIPATRTARALVEQGAQIRPTLGLLKHARERLVRGAVQRIDGEDLAPRGLGLFRTLGATALELRDVAQQIPAQHAQRRVKHAARAPAPAWRRFPGAW